jgi:predicted nucleic acid-binding protein
VKPKKIVVHSDIIYDHLLHTGQGASMLRNAMKKYLCYTTVVNAMEVFSCAGSARQTRVIQDALGAMKILGLNSRTAKNFGTLMRRYPGYSFADLLVAGICLDSNLSLLTMQRERFRNIKRLSLVQPTSIE